MRVMEAAVLRLAQRLRRYGVTVKDRNGKILAWGPLLGNINRAVQSMPRGAKQDQWSEVCTLLFHTKNAWRNDTMHPAERYDAGQARDVFNAVKVFMGVLASLV